MVRSKRDRRRQLVWCDCPQLAGKDAATARASRDFHAARPLLQPRPPPEGGLSCSFETSDPDRLAVGPPPPIFSAGKVCYKVCWPSVPDADRKPRNCSRGLSRFSRLGAISMAGGLARRGNGAIPLGQPPTNCLEGLPHATRGMNAAAHPSSCGTGRLDAATTPAFEAHCQQAARRGRADLILDFGPLEYISSARTARRPATAKAAGAAGGEFTLANAQGSSGSARHLRLPANVPRTRLSDTPDAKA